MAGRHRSRSPSYTRRRPSPPPRRRHDDSPDRSSSKRRSPSPRRKSSKRSPSPQRRSNGRSPSPSRGSRRRPPSPSGESRKRSGSRERGTRYNRSNQYNSEIEGFPILPGESYSDYRSRVRDSSTKTIWAASPSRPMRSPSPIEDRKHKSKKSKRHYSDTESSEEDSSEEEERRRRRHKKKSSKHKTSRKHKSSSRKRYASESESEEDNRKKKRASTTEEKSVLEVDRSHLDQVQDLWVEKQVDLPDDLAPVGPVPLSKTDDHDQGYGGALLPGEGEAMAAYVKEGKRIPRRGEIGLSGDQIGEFEKAGYVMSGNRHQRMNAVRLRKENQVISAEEKRLVLQHAQEQKIKRENEIISGFREILSDKFKKEE